MSISMNLEYYDFLFGQIDEFLKANSAYVERKFSSSGKELPFLKKKPAAAKPDYPQVILTEISNAHSSMTLGRREVISLLGYEVDVFSTNKVIKGKTVDSLTICRELTGLADYVLSRYGFRRLSSTPTPVVDTTLSRIISRYNGRMFNNFNQIL